MPPRKGIVKSGNAGNSSKAAKANPVTPVALDKPLPLFPPGSKYPLSLLQERCQKFGWEKPVVDAHQHGNQGFAFVVTLSRFNTKNSEMETVRMEPHPPYHRPTAVEAKHWGATYALYRCCNAIQLNLVLPPGPREYWQELTNERKTVPEHRQWMYDADPFSAKRRLEAQGAAQKSREFQAFAADPARHKSAPSMLQSTYPEVLMAASLREMVEDGIKQALALCPGALDSVSMTLPPDSAAHVNKQLQHLGFNKNQTSNVIKFLSEESSLSSTLLNALPPLEACIEYLVLHVPECDLPQRFLPSRNSSNPFVTAAYSGPTDIKRRWIEEKAIKEAGWPANTVKGCTANAMCIERLDFLIVSLGQRLLGQAVDESPNPTVANFYDIKEDEFEAMGGAIVEPGHLELPLFTAPLSVHILFSNTEYYPRPGYIPVYLTSSTIPAYVRLHLLSCFLQTMSAHPELEVDEGFCMALMRIIESEWAVVEDNGPPDVSMVLQHLIIPRQHTPVFREVKSARGRSLEAVPIRKPNRVGTDAELEKKLRVMQQDDKYKALLRTRSSLPAFAARDEFLCLLEMNNVVVVVGETGCGKTTQIPQFILDSLILSNRGNQASILVTQPRRISAVSVASRVSEERLNDGSVGYSIRGETMASKNTQLLFCTTGVALRRLSTGDNLEDISHVVVDEVHERSMDGDFLLLELKDLLRTRRNLKVVLMSATINHEVFVNYFDGAPLLKIPGFTHPVTDKYLEDLLPEINYRPKNTKPIAGDNLIDLKIFQDAGLAEHVVDALYALTRADKIDYQLIASLVSHIVKTGEKAGGILIFLSGVAEIKQCIEAVEKAVDRNGVVVLPLHANLSMGEQKKVFDAAKSWKVIAATNVAETSVTIEGVIYVIDTGKVKETHYDPETNLSRLLEVRVTRAAARQRRGRAGRTQPGVCYKLYTRQQENKLPEFPIPEILRVPLENISLSVKASKDNQDVVAFLSQAVDAPSTTSIDRALRTLEEIGAINEDGKLTALGKHMALLPMDVRLSKMLILATIFQCLGPIVTVVALLSSKPLFVTPMDKREESTAARARFFTGDSDLLTNVKAFDECLKMDSEGRGHAAIRKFCEDNFISTATLREVITLRKDFVFALSDIGFIPADSTPSTPNLNRCSKNLNLIKSIILGGLWPRVARIHLPKEKIKFDKVAAGTVERENVAKDFKIYDLHEGRVFLHPGSVLFHTASWKPPFLVYFHKHMTSKIFLRDASKVPTYALLLFGGPVSVDNIRGGLTVGKMGNCIKLRAIPRIGVLVNQLRRLLDAQLQSCIEEGAMLTVSANNPITHAMMALLTHDGKTE